MVKVKMDMKNMHEIKIIGFDADDTLWINEPYYKETEQKFCNLLKNFLPENEISEILFEVEMDNLAYYGFGAKAFVLSLIESALRIGKSNISTTVVEQIIDLGKDLLDKPVILLEGVKQVLENLKSRNIRMIIATKGDLLDQERKLKKSGIGQYFHHVEVMSDKKDKDYEKLLNHLDIQPKEFLMIGNSVRSDIIPVMNIGGQAIHVPYHTNWDYEKVDKRDNHHSFKVADDFLDVLKWI